MKALGDSFGICFRVDDGIEAFYVVRDDGRNGITLSLKNLTDGITEAIQRKEIVRSNKGIFVAWIFRVRYAPKF